MKTKAKDRKDFKTAQHYADSKRSRTAIINAIRAEWMVYRAKFVAIARHVKEVELDGEKRRLVECQGCFQLARRDEIHAHHLTEVGGLPSTSVEDIQAYQDRMFCRASGIVPYCHQCHHKHHNP